MEDKAGIYNEKFYEGNVVGSLKSAKIVLGLLKEHYEFRSLVDFGCGRGTWLKAALDLGAVRAVGYDGPWNEGKIIDSVIEFVPTDLTNIALDDELFDLAISLEVAEHLPEAYADQFVNSITKKSSLIVFGSAFIRQRGTSHLNEQFPSYWANKFSAKGFYPVDFFRPKIWQDRSIDACYRQNTFLYVKKGDKKLVKIFKEDYLKNNFKFMDCMHPDLYLSRSGRDLISDFMVGMKRIIKSKFS